MFFHPLLLRPFSLIFRLQHHFHLHSGPYLILLQTIQAWLPYYNLHLSVFIEHLWPRHLSPPVLHLPLTIQLSFLRLLLLYQPIQETLLLINRMLHLLSLSLLQLHLAFQHPHIVLVVIDSLLLCLHLLLSVLFIPLSQVLIPILSNLSRVPFIYHLMRFPHYVMLLHLHDPVLQCLLPLLIK